MKPDKKPIAVITTVHYCQDTRIYYKQVNSLSKKFMVDYYAPCNEDLDLKCSGTSIPLYASTSKLGRIRTNIQLCFLLLKRQYSIYHLHDPELLLIGLILKLLQKKVIFDLHENIFDDFRHKKYIPSLLRPMILYFLEFLFNLAQKKFDWVFLAEESYKKIIKTSKHETILNYPVLKRIEIPLKKTWEHGLAYVGSITSERGIWDMLGILQEVHNILKDATLHLIGPVGEAGLQLRMQKWIYDNSLENHIILYGQMPNERIYSILSHTNIGLCLLNDRTLFSESLPTKMFEYMMVGLPIVITNCQFWKKIVDECNCGIVVAPHEHRVIAQKIASLLENQQELKKLGQNGLRAVENSYNWLAEEKKLLHVYDTQMRL